MHLSLSRWVNPVAKNQKRGASRRVIQSKSPNGRGSKNPPQLLTSVALKHRLRYVVNNAGGIITKITNTALLDSLCMATNAVAAARLCDGYKIMNIEIWSANGSGNLSNTISLEWVDSPIVGGPGFVVTDTVLGLADIAHVCTSPPAGSLSSFWLPNSGAEVTLCNLQLPQGSIVDITMGLVLADTDAPVFVTAAVVGATAGKFYCRYLDSTSTNVLVPVGFDSI